MHKDKRFYNVFTDVNGPSKFLVKYYSIFLMLLILTLNEIVLKNICIFIFTILRNVMDHRILKQIGQNSATLNHIRFLRLICLKNFFFILLAKRVFFSSCFFSFYIASTSANWRQTNIWRWVLLQLSKIYTMENREFWLNSNLEEKFQKKILPFRKSYSHTIFELFFSDLYSDELEEDTIGSNG